ncbi:MAG: signal peptidase II [Pseudomonadota bacterium]|jgi:signal peptidase II
MTGASETEMRTPAVTRWGWVAYAIAAAVILLDQISKLWILSFLPVGATVEVFWPLQFTRIWNEGVSFGMFQAEHNVVRWGLVLFSIGVAVLLTFWARSQDRGLQAVGLGLIIGGAIGNAIDRARFGAVVDFIDVQRIGFFPWIFNIADSGITIGVIALLLDSLRRERPS